MNSSKLDIKITSGDIPGIVYGDIKSSKNIFLYLNTANGNKSVSKFWKLPEFEHSCLYIIDLPGHGDCKIKSSKHWKFYVKCISETIYRIRREFRNIINVYLVGESFGANLAILTVKKHSEQVDSCIAINPPLRVRNPKHDKKIKDDADSFISLVFKYAVTITTNINTYTIPHGIEQLTSNPVFLRVWHMSAETKKQDTRINLACWWSMDNTRKYILSHYKHNGIPPIWIISSKKDFYYCKNQKTFDKISIVNNFNNKLFLLEEGEHFLDLDKNNCCKLWEIVKQLDK